MAPRKTSGTAPTVAQQQPKTSTLRLRSVKLKPGFTGTLGMDQTQGLRAMYQAAGHGPRAADSFRYANGWSAEYLLGKTLDVVQRRVLQEVRDNPIAGRMVDVIVRTTVGRKLEPKIQDPDLKRLWKRWSRKAGADGRLSFDALMALALREVAVKGEVLLRNRTRTMEDVKNGMVPVPYQVELIGSEFMPLTRVGEPLVTDPDAEFRSGIFFNGIGQRRAYLLLRKHPRNGDLSGFTRDDTVVVPASELMHVFMDRESGQLRGEPWLVRSIIRLHELDEYMDAELAKKKAAAKVTMVWTAPEPKVGAGMIESADGEVEIVEDEFSFIPKDIRAGAQVVTPPGWQVEGFRANEVGGDFDVFTRKVLMEACAAAHAPYELVTGDFSMTQERMVRFFYKATYEQTVAARREMLISQAAAPIFYRFVQEAVASGAWTPPAGESWEDYAEPEWSGSPMPYPNILQDYNAAGVAIGLGLKSISEACRDFGRDPDEVAEELRADLQRFAGLPVKMILDAAARQMPTGDTYPPQNEQGTPE